STLPAVQAATENAAAAACSLSSSSSFPSPLISSSSKVQTTYMSGKRQADAQTEPACRGSLAVADMSLREQLAASAVNAAVEAATALGAGGVASSKEFDGDEESGRSRDGSDDGGGSTGSSSCREGRRSGSSAKLGRGLGGAERSSPVLYRSPLTHAALSIKVTDVGEVAFEEACASLQSAALRAVELLLGGAVDLAPGEAESVEAATAAAAAAEATAETRTYDREGHKEAHEALGAVDTRGLRIQEA
ncbi:hypothetical protein Vretimale_17206, partial [Volvox reticuliferus]